MTIDDKLLKLKTFTSLQKLILGLIMDVTPIVLKFEGGYNNTCGDMAKEIGSSRNKVRREVDDLIERGYITCKVEYRSRVTNITQKLIALMNYSSS